MDGHRRWLAGGKKIGTCDAVEAETSDYYSAQSTVETWIAERCVVEAVAAQPGRYWVTPMEAYTNYRLWKEGRGENPTNMTRFSEQLSQRFEKMRANGARFRGLRLKHRADPD